MVNVSTHEELADALTHSKPINLTNDIVIDRQVYSEEPDVFITSEEKKWLDFRHIPATLEQTNGLMLKSESVSLENIGFKNFNGKGSALKCHVNNSVDLFGCSFHDIGNTIGPISKDSKEDFTTQGIGSHQVSKHFSMIECEFDNVSTHCNRWAHCVYATAEVMNVQGNRFYRTGNPLALGRYFDDPQLVVTRNFFNNPGLIFAPYFDEPIYELTYLLVLNPQATGVFSNNVITGNWRMYFHSIGEEFDVADNDFSHAQYQSGWCFQPGIGYLDEFGKEL